MKNGCQHRLDMDGKTAPPKLGKGAPNPPKWSLKPSKKEPECDAVWAANHVKKLREGHYLGSQEHVV